MAEPNEGPPTGPESHTGRPEEPSTGKEQSPSGPSARGGTSREDIQRLIGEYGGVFARSVEQIEREGEIKDKEAKDKAERLQRALKQLLREIRDPELAKQLEFLPELTRKVLASVHPDAITEKNTPLLYLLLRGSIGQDLERGTALNTLAAGLLGTRVVDEKMAKKILDPVSEKMDEIGVRGETFEGVSKFLSKSAESTDPSDKLFKEHMRTIQRFENFLDELPIPDHVVLRHLQDTGELARMDEAVRNGTISPDVAQSHIADKIDIERGDIRHGMKRFARAIKNATTSEEHDQHIDELRAYLRDLVQKGYFDQSKWEMVVNETNSLREHYDQIEKEGAEEGANLLAYTARQAGITSFSTPEAQKLFIAMGNNTAFIRYIKEEYIEVDRDGKRRFDWDRFISDTRNIFQDILTIAEGRPYDFFQEAFIEFYEGHLYRVLTSRLTELGRIIHEDNDLRGITVEIEDTTSMENRGQPGTELHGKEHLLHKGTVERSLVQAIGETLRNKIIMIKNLTEFLHNTNAIVDVGLKWETMAEQAERVSQRDVDWLFANTPDLRDAYNLYISTLTTELGLNRHIAPSAFGKPNDRELDFAQQTVFNQLLARKTGGMGIEDVSPVLEQKLRGIVRMASALAKGFTGEFWGVLLSARMPMTFEGEHEIAVLDRKGRPIKWRNPETGKKEIKTVKVPKVKQLVTSVHQNGFEKMLGQIDMDIVLERFGVPDLYYNVRYTYAPRDLENFRGAYSSDPFNGFYDHSIIYKIRDAVQASYFEGRSNFLAAFDENNVTFSESLKADTIDMIYRFGWRFNQYKAYIVYEKPKEGFDIGEAKIDFEATMYNLKKKGFRAIMAFIDDKDMFGETPDESRLSHDIRTQFSNHGEYKQYMYEKYIFERMIDIHPSLWFGIETPRYTPQGEKFIDDRLTDWLIGHGGAFGGFPIEYVHDHVMKLFITSLNVAEKDAWEGHNRDAKMRVVTKTAGDVEKFDEPDLDASERQLKQYFNLYKKRTLVRFTDAQGIEYNLDGITEEDYFKTLKGFFRELKNVLKKQRKTLAGDKGKPEFLHERYAKMLKNKIGNLAYLIGGSDFDFADFDFSQAGRRIAARAMVEANVLASQMNPAFFTLINEAMPKFATSGITGGEEMMKALEELLKPVKEASDAYARNVNPEEGRKIALRLGIFLERMLGKDRKYRMKGPGDLLELLVRSRHGTQVSLLNDIFTHRLGRPVTALESEDLVAMGKLLSRMCDIPWDEKKIAGSEPLQTLSAKFLRTITGGRINLERPVYANKIVDYRNKDTPIANFLRKISSGKLGKEPIFEEGHTVHMGQFRKAVGTTPGARTFEVFGPITALIAAILILMQLRVAYKATEEKR